MTNKFKGVFDAAKQREAAPKLVEVLAPAADELAAKESRAKEILRSADRGSRKRLGKRSDPDYELTSVFLRKELYSEVRIRLLREGRPKEFSELVGELLSRWMEG